MHQDSPTDERRLQILESLGTTLAAKRQLAINHRANSGIEQIWVEDEEFYMGIDDANRGEFGGTVEKPTTSGSRAQRTDQDPTKSTIFPNITQPYVDAAAARIGDMLLPTDDRNFVLEPTPIPDMLDFESQLDEAPQAGLPGPQPQAGLPGPQPQATPDPSQSPGSPPQQLTPPTTGVAPVPAAPAAPPAAPERMIMLPDGNQVTETDLRRRIAEVKAEAIRRTGRAQTQIDDWLTESCYLDEWRQCIDDCAKVGTGVLKGPIPTKRQRKKWSKNATGEIVMATLDEIKPGTKSISYWNLYPDPACGNDIHRGSWIWEMDVLSEKKVKELKGLPGYLDSQLDVILEEGPAKYTVAGKVPYNENDHKGQYQIWYFHGTVSKEDIEAAGCKCAEGASFEALITMINDHVVRAALNPLDSGEFPYDVMRWKRRTDHWAGVGVGRQMRTSQKMVVAGARNLMDNAGMGAGPMFVVGRGIRPQNNIWEVKPRKFWVRDDDDIENRPVREDFEAITIPMLQAELTAIIQLGMKMAEDSTGLPMLLQGQQGSAPDTVGGMQILNNNGSAVLRRIARLFDRVTTAHIQRYYDWLMLYSDDEDAKGDMQVKARGSSALVERDAQTMELAQIVGMTLNPTFKKDPAKAMDEYLKSRRFDPEAFDYSEEDLARMQNAQQPEAPAVTAAKIRAKAQLEAAQMQNETQQHRVEVDTDRDAAYVNAETERTRLEHEGRMAELAVRERLAMLDYANKRNVSLDKVKADLAKTAITVKAQRELAAQRNASAPQVAKPVFEPKGRAPNGQAFQA